jgi:hypothetical protein
MLVYDLYTYDKEIGHMTDHYDKFEEWDLELEEELEEYLGELDDDDLDDLESLFLDEDDSDEDLA